jgi:hypothetical protein
MKTYTVEELREILAEHGKWLRGEGGNRADLQDANLQRANLRDANLQGADLQDANLQRANLQRANLQRANLRDANLQGADLQDANLQRANLQRANLQRANLQRADLPHFQICAGDLIVYKKVDGHIVTLAIPRYAKRTASIVGRKCRAEYAIVLETDDHEPHESKPPGEFAGITYKEGETVRPDSYDDDFRVECSHGIHFFQTRAEAKEWDA